MTATRTRTRAPLAPAAKAPAHSAADKPSPKGKLGALIALMLKPEGATLQALQDATGWQAHSVRGAIAGSIKKKLGFTVISEKAAVGRVYRIAKAGA